MAGDPFNQEEGSNPFARALKSGLVLAPIALAGYTGFQRVSANSALNPVAAAKASLGPGRLGSTGRAVGQELQRTARDSHTRLLQHASDELDKLMEADAVQELFQNVEQQRAVIQSVLDTIDDPTSGVPEDFKLSYRQKLVDIAQNSLTGTNAEEVMSSVIRALNDDNMLTGDARARWASNLREYKNVAPYLQPPRQQLNAGQIFNEIQPSALQQGSVALNRYKQLVGGLGDNGSRFVSLAEYGSGANRQIYARVYSAGGASTQGAFLGTVPLDLGQTSNSRYTQLRMNEGLTTGYRANRFVIDAQKAAGVLGSGTPNMARLQQAGALVDIEDYYLREFLNRAQPTGRGLSIAGGRNDFGAWQRQVLAADARLVSSGQPFVNAQGMRAHVMQAAGFQHNFATVANFGRMSQQQRSDIMKNLAAVPGMETGIGAGRILSRGQGFENYGTMGLYRGSALEALQSTSLTMLRRGGPNRLVERGLFPATSRIEQVPGREAAFVNYGAAQTMGRGGVYTAGATARVLENGDISPVGRNIEWASSVTGGTNKAVLLDVSESGKVYQALAGTGAAYHRGTEIVREAFTKPVLEPAGRGRLGSALMNEVVKRAKEGELVRFSRAELKKYGMFLGVGPSGMQYLRNDPRMTGARIGYEVTEVGGKRHVNIVGEIERQLETFKGFSLMHKGTLQEISEAAERGLVGDYVDVMEGLGIAPEHRVYAAGDMLKKGAGFFDLQMTSAYGLVTGEKDARAKLAKLASGATGALAGSSTGRVTSAVIQGMAPHLKADRISAREAGLVLGAVYTRGESWIKGLNASEAVARKDIESAIMSAYGDKLGRSVIGFAKQGKAIAATTYTQGTGVGDYGLGRGSAEPRFFSTLQHRLRRMGLSSKGTSDFLAGIYRNKIAYGAHLKSAQGMLKLAESVAGVQGASDAAAMIRDGIPTYGLNDLAKLGPEIKSKGVEAFMAKHSDGFVLDLIKGADTPATRAVASAAGDVFRQGQVFIPGREVLGAMRGTMIKTAEGSVAIEDEYSRMVKNFVDDLTTLSHNKQLAERSAREQLGAFKAQAMDMAGKVIHQVAGGKIRGMQSQVAAIYDLTQGTGFSSQAKAQLAENIFKHTKGMSVFMDTKGFLSQLNDFMGGTLTSADAAKKAEMFFTSLENAADSGVSSHKARGIVSIASRHPLLSVGNVTPTQIFRHVEEVGAGAADDVFQKFLATEAGAQYRGVGGFADVANRSHKFRSKFFKDFVNNLSDFAGEGGGRIFLPRMMENIHYNDTHVGVDFGISGAAIGDWDGDQWQMLMVNEESGKSIMSTLKSSAQRDQWLTGENSYKIKSEIFAEEAKKGLKRHQIAMEGQIGFADIQRIQQDLMKESASKNLVGSLDVRMNKLRAAILDMSMGNPQIASQAEEAMALLKVVQEHAVIKGKKLPVFKAFASMLGGSIDEMFEGAGASSLRRVMREEIFPGSDLVGSGIRVTSGGGRTAQSAAAVESMTGSMMKLDSTLDFIQSAVNRARTTGVADYPSQARLAMGMSGDIVEAERAFNTLRAAQTTQGGMIAGFGDDMFRNVAAQAGNFFTNVRSAAQRLDRKTQGMLAMGGMAALGIGALVSNEGYGAEPIVGDMETVSPRVRSGITTGKVLSQRDNTGPRPSDFERGANPYATQGRPVNVPTTYMNPPSSYQVRGQLYEDNSIPRLSSYMSTVSGGNVAGSVRINDGRRAITQNYIDRLMGEY